MKECLPAPLVASTHKNLLLPITGNAIITNPKIRTIMDNNNIFLVDFKDNPLFLCKEDACHSIFYNMTLNDLTASELFKYVTNIRNCNISKGINEFSIITVEGYTTLISFE